MWLIFFIQHLYLIGVCGYARIKEQRASIHMFNRDWAVSSNFINCFTLNSEHNWEDLYIQLRYQQADTPDNQN